MIGSSSNKFRGNYIPEDKDQALVETPYGKGLVIRTRKDGKNGNALMREIALTDWVKPERSKGPQRPSKLFSPTKFPSVKPEIGNDVMTVYGRGKVIELRPNDQCVVQISSWRLAGRSKVTCYLARDAVQVVRPHKQYEMTVHEKVEHGQELKKQASTMFCAKKYKEALELYAKAVDAVRYAQHTKDSSNELRSDLLVVMITCCNNAATCSLQLREWDRALEFGKNAVILLDALYEKKGNSKIHELLNKEGFKDSQLFGAWKAKSYLVMARALAERHFTEESIDNLKKGLNVVTEYKKEDDSMYKQLQGQEKELYKLLVACKERRKAERKKEKQRARAMFGATEEKKDPDNKDAEPHTTTNTHQKKSDKPESIPKKYDIKMQKATENDPKRRKIPKKKVSFADGSTPGSVDDEEPSFFDEHKEALFILAGLGLGSTLVHMLLKRRR